MKKAICISFVIIQLITVSLLLFAAGSTDYYIKREQLYTNVMYALAGLVLTAVLCFVADKLRKRFEAGIIKHTMFIVPVTILLFFVLAVYLCISGFFFSDWDPAAILYGVYGVLRGHPEDTGAVYFSNHPNNLLLVWIYVSVLRITGLAGIDSVIVLIVFQCVLSSLSAFVFYRIIRGLTGDTVTAYTGLIVYEVWIVLSPWFIITYSDEAGILFPLLILGLYQRTVTHGAGQRNIGINWILMSILAAAGYFIKPQILLAYIAVCILFFSSKTAGNAKNRLICLVSGIVTIVISVIIIKAAIIPSLGIKIDKDRSFGMAHYFMMGLNDETDGVYSDEDTLYTDSFGSPEKKRRADMELASRRIDAYGFGGLIEHAEKKTLVNFGDGLFAWGVDGKFFAGRKFADIGEVPENRSTASVWSFIMPEGSNHGKYSSFLQMLWITVLILDLAGGIVIGIALFSEKSTAFGTKMQTEERLLSSQRSEVIPAAMLSLLFLFFFELVFEAKARYLFIYTPYYLLIAVTGVYLLLIGMRKRTSEAAEGKTGR